MFISGIRSVSFVTFLISILKMFPSFTSILLLFIFRRLFFLLIICKPTRKKMKAIGNSDSKRIINLLWLITEISSTPISFLNCQIKINPLWLRSHNIFLILSGIGYIYPTSLRINPLISIFTAKFNKHPTFSRMWHTAEILHWHFVVYSSARKENSNITLSLLGLVIG